MSTTPTPLPTEFGHHSVRTPFPCQCIGHEPRLPRSTSMSDRLKRIETLVAHTQNCEFTDSPQNHMLLAAMRELAILRRQLTNSGALTPTG